MWTDLPLFLAQTDAESPPPPVDTTAVAPEAGEGALIDPNGGVDTTAAPPASPFGGTGFLMLMAVALLFIFLMGGGRREKKKRAAMIAALAKGDKVQTIGGIRGTVLEVKDDEVVLKVDENANTRMRFATSAVQTVLESKKNDE